VRRLITLAELLLVAKRTWTGGALELLAPSDGIDELDVRSFPCARLHLSPGFYPQYLEEDAHIMVQDGKDQARTTFHFQAWEHLGKVEEMDHLMTSLLFLAKQLTEELEKPGGGNDIIWIDIWSSFVVLLGTLEDRLNGGGLSEVDWSKPDLVTRWWRPNVGASVSDHEIETERVAARRFRVTGNRV
jgi:hypothetical protein